MNCASFLDVFELLKELLRSSVTLNLLQRVGRVSVTCDALDYAVGYCLESGKLCRETYE